MQFFNTSDLGGFGRITNDPAIRSQKIKTIAPIEPNKSALQVYGILPKTPPAIQIADINNALNQKVADLKDQYTAHLEKITSLYQYRHDDLNKETQNIKATLNVLNEFKKFELSSTNLENNPEIKSLLKIVGESQLLQLKVFAAVLHINFTKGDQDPKYLKAGSLSPAGGALPTLATGASIIANNYKTWEQVVTGTGRILNSISGIGKFLKHERLIRDIQKNAIKLMNLEANPAAKNNMPLAEYNELVNTISPKILNFIEEFTSQLTARNALLPK
jgi:hypothetical protein